MSLAEHWDDVFRTKPRTDVSWFEAEPTTSLELVRSVTTPSAAVIDVGAGTADLARRLASDGYQDITVLDISAIAIDSMAALFTDIDHKPNFVVADVTKWLPGRTYDVWHDRAVFHFMVTEEMRNDYRATLTRAVHPGGFAIIGAFAEDGPEQCSGITVARQSAESIAAFFSTDFELVRSFDRIHRTPRGVDQHFAWVTLRRC